MTLAYTELGTGEPLVLVNGYGGAKGDWDPTFLDGLGQTSRVIAPDNRGIGDSPGLEGDLTVESMAVDTIALMDELGLDRAALVGWSMGGMIAQEVAATVPERVTGLVLMSTNRSGRDGVGSTDEVRRKLIDHSGTPRERATRLISILFPAAFAKQVDAQFGDIVAAAQAALPPETMEAQTKALGAWHRQEPNDRLERITAPVLVMAGGADVVVPPENAEILSGALPESWLARFAGGGHAFMAQEPDRAAALIRAFLGR